MNTVHKTHKNTSSFFSLLDFSNTKLFHYDSSMSLKADTEKKGTYLQIYGVLFDKLVRRFPQNERDVVEKEKEDLAVLAPS